ncbi:MAG: SusC/RagA family TonB-linked outer membrane protein [Tannerella sp.]|jgi:TonB-linked SusC/RagA family outer membrane protein|nr:SusC/RagA family TonB-linked outer membrane protein [Tannerella sp.]
MKNKITTKMYLIGIFLLICTVNLLASTGITPTEKTISTAVIQQTRQISGIVVDINGEAIIGANVIQKDNHTNGAVTDINGGFVLTVPENVILIVSYIGYIQQEINIGSQSSLRITLQEDLQALDEVVVIGYGTRRKRDLTGAVAQMKSSEVINEAPRDVRDILRANVAGLNIAYSTGAKPGGDIEIRGRSSLTAGGDPLLVVDGSIYYGGLEDINPADIETIDILKDASSAAVYGAKSASGVIVIMTRKGSQGKPKIDVNTTFGFVTMSVNQPVYDGAGYLQWRSDLQNVRYQSLASANPGMYQDPRKLPSGVTQEQWLNYDTNDGDMIRTWLRRLELQDNEIENYIKGKETDWYDAVFRNGKQQDYNVSLSGKREDITYYWSIGYANNEGLIVGDGFSTIRSRLNLDADVTRFLTVGVSTQLALRDESKQYWDSSGRDQYVRANWEEGIRTASPWGDMYNEDGTYRRRPNGTDTETQNPFYDMSYLTRDRTYTTLNSILYLKLTLPFNVTFQSTFTPRFSFHNYLNHQSSEHEEWGGFGGRVRRESEKIYQWQIDNLLRWQQTFGAHSFELTLLQNAEKYSSWWTMVEGSNFSPNDLLGMHYLNGATTFRGESNDEVSTGAAYMARLYYSLMDKYMVTATYRRDGYSAFGQMHPWANFSSLALAWRFTEENFFPESWKKVLDHGKLRLSYGTNGNRDIGRYQALANLNSSSKYYYVDAGSGNLIPNSVLFVDRMMNRELKWESIGSFNLGLDFTLRNQTIDGSIEVYSGTTTDLLMNRSLPDITGFDRVVANLGEVQNRGLEITLNSNNIRNDKLTWRTSFSFSTNQNKILHLYGDMIDIVDKDGNVIGQKEADDPSNTWFIGKPVNAIWELNPKGVWQIGEEAEAAKYGAIPGDFKITKREEPTDGRYALTNDDKEFLGQTDPKFRWTLRNDFTLFKNFSLSFMIYSYWGQKKQYNFPKNTRTSMQRRSDYVIPYWTPENPINTHARLFSRDPAVFNIYWDNSFISLDNISLAYNVPATYTRKAGVENLKLFFTVRKVAVWAPKWEFWDPESNGPTPRTFTFGLNFSL